MTALQTRRTYALCLAALFTLAVLGGIQNLAQPHDTVMQWAQQSSIQA